MRLPLSWVKDYVTVKLPPAKLAEQMTIAGIGVERIRQSVIPDGVVVGSVLSVAPHPNADRLKVVSVSLGKGDPRQIVCGAPNIAAGQKVPVALPGTKLPNGVTIAEASIRGVRSSGMICAADELGLGDDHTGIIVLDTQATVGQAAARALGAGEIILELEVTPNRADCLSVLGCAREIAAVTKAKIRVPKFDRPDRSKLSSRQLAVQMQDRAACPFYTARVIERIQVGPSPSWLRARLEAAGIRPINVVIDVTNYVMLDVGQPLHAFDARALPDRKIVVRRAKSGEQLHALDGKTYPLSPEILVIASSKAPIALAGIMGGEASGVQASTRDVVLESAVFDPLLVRKTSKKLGLISESSYRFERSVNPAMTVAALDAAATLLAKLAGGKVVRGRTVTGKIPRPPKPIALNLERVNYLLSLSLSSRAVVDLLKRDGARTSGTGKRLRVTPPVWRQDLAIEEDLIEEIGRLYGFPDLPLTHLMGTLRPAPLPPIWKLCDDLTSILAAAGGVELKNYPFYDGQLAARLALAKEQHLTVRNPLSREQELLRLELAPLVLKKAAMAVREESVLFLYEIGRCFAESGGPLPEESDHCALAATGPDAYRRLKGVLEHALDALGIPRTARSWEALSNQYGSGQRLLLHGHPAGGCVALSPARTAELKFRENAAVVELNLRPLSELRQERQYRHVIPFPPVRRDLAFWVPDSVTYDQVAAAIRGADPLLTEVELFDVFEKDRRRSLALHLTFQSPQRTLTAHEVETALERLREKLVRACGASIRQS